MLTGISKLQIRQKLTHLKVFCNNLMDDRENHISVISITFSIPECTFSTTCIHDCPGKKYLIYFHFIILLISECFAKNFTKICISALDKSLPDRSLSDITV
ncbi:hypothetical protein ABEB36_015443 [Hypothenemus hampei]|uniref:Uncharacterized protein n=1 Tax=Hypothenemus hampei TaxID=57062 RepID=A0ABD1E0H9_HYPHA